MSENISSLKMMGPAETEEIDSLISVSACNTAAVKSKVTRVSVQGVQSLLGDCRFIPVDWGSY